MLVVVENRNVHPRATLRFNFKTLRCFYVLKVYAPKCWLHRDDNIDKLGHILLIQLDIETIDTGEFLEQDRFAFHHRFGRQWPDVAKSKHRRSVGHDRNQILTDREFCGLRLIRYNRFTRGRNARRVRKCQVSLVSQWFDRLNFELTGPWIAVIKESARFQILRDVVHSPPLPVGRLTLPFNCVVRQRGSIVCLNFA